MRRRDAASAGAASPGAAPAGVGARPEATQRSAPDNQQKAMSAAERSQSIAPGETGATSTRGASGLANENAGTAGALQMPSAPRRNNSLEALNDGDTLATARLVVAPPRDLSRARLRVVGARGVRLSQSSSQQAPPQKASSQIVWSGTARRGQEITVPLRLQIVVPGTLRVILEEAAGSGWKTVREQNLSVWSR
jgi:hypothetical protein